MPISFRDVAEIDAYVPTVPHPLPGEVPLIAADVTGVPPGRLPLPPGVAIESHTVCSRDFLRPLLPSSFDDAKIDQVIADLFGRVKYYPKKAREESTTRVAR
ncbi:hypothetical protein SO694_00013414 [Aureococcus anophagefferens]|uniref:Uncharacterized protein n=1 Tax=Aureococcus anophagefferens TaxID=44056 RepID=A0ABR1G145_AURAN|nr:hypothetical protein JL722_10466 [Aureococcus anophagefferens]